MSDPLPSFRFRVEIDASGFGAAATRIEAACSECSGLRVATETVEYKEGGLNETTHQFRSQTRFPPLTLKRGLAASSDLWQWYAAVVAGQVVRRDGVIWLLDGAGGEQWRWDFYGAYPIKWSGPDLHAGTGALAFEAVELVHRGFTMRSAQ